MKKWMIVVAAGVLAVSMTSCKSGKSSSSGSEQAVESSAAGAESQAEAGQEESKEEGGDMAEEEIPNPFKELDGPEDLKELQLSMEVPEEASDALYQSIDNEIGEVFFTLDDHRYTYRGAAHAEEFSGIFEEFEDEQVAVSDIGADEDLVIKTTVSGGRLASWAKGGAKYILYTPDAVEDEEMIKLCSALIAKN